MEFMPVIDGRSSKNCFILSFNLIVALLHYWFVWWRWRSYFRIRIGSNWNFYLHPDISSLLSAWHYRAKNRTATVRQFCFHTYEPFSKMFLFTLCESSLFSQQSFIYWKSQYHRHFRIFFFYRTRTNHFRLQSH